MTTGRQRRGSREPPAGEKPLRVLVRGEQRLHLAAQPGIVATLARKKRVALYTRRRHGGVKDREHVLPAFGDHSR